MTVCTIRTPDPTWPYPQSRTRTSLPSLPDFQFLRFPPLARVRPLHNSKLRSMLLRAAHQRTLNLTTLTRSSSMLSPSSASPPPYHAWRSNPPSATPPDAHTYKADPALPRLPVPDLDTTLQRLARSCSPLATETQRRALDDKIRAFGREGGVGQKLQKQLVKRREEPYVVSPSVLSPHFSLMVPTLPVRRERRNWLAQWWDELGYMQYRDSVVGNVSYYYGVRSFLLSFSPPVLPRFARLLTALLLQFDRLPQSATNPSSPSSGDPAYVAASIAKTALDFRRLLMKSLLEPDLAGRKPSDGTLCMESYKWAFNACRVPAQPGDYAVKVAEDSKEAQHFVVVKKNRFYSVPIAHEGHEYGVEQLRSAIQSAIARAEKEGKGPAVGVLTGVNRDHWTEVGSLLLFPTVETFVLIPPPSPSSHRLTRISSLLPSTSRPSNPSKPPPSSSALTKPHLLPRLVRKVWQTSASASGSEARREGTGGGTSRCSGSCTRTARAASSASIRAWTVRGSFLPTQLNPPSSADFFPSPPPEGTPTARLNDFISSHLLTAPPSHSPCTCASPTPVPLRFDLDSTSLNAITAAETEFAEHIEPYDVHYLSYQRYGKDGIKAMGASPDGWFVF